MDTIRTRKLIEELEAAKREQQRCMGGVDPVGAVKAARRVTELRLALRDDATFIDHIDFVRTHRPR